MSQRTRLSQFESHPNMTTATALASEFIENRRKQHGMLQMRADDPNGTGGGTGGSGAGEGGGGNTGGAGGEGAPSGENSASGGSGEAGDPQKKITALQEEKDRHFQARQAAEEELKKYKAAEEERERAGNDELTNTKKDLQAAQETIAQLQSSLDDQLLNNAFLTDNTYKWQNPARVLQIVDRSSVDIKDGKVSGIKEALESLAKSDPYLLKSDDSGGEGSSGGGQTGGQNNGNRNNSNNGQKSREELSRKYPALRR